MRRLGCVIASLTAVWLACTGCGTPSGQGDQAGDPVSVTPSSGEPSAPVSTPPGGSAAGVTVSGRVYYDRDNDGRWDPAVDTGLAGIKVTSSNTTDAAVTGADGGYSVALPAKVRFLQVMTGWMRSRCDASQTCAPSAKDPAAGPDNDFGSDNHFIRIARDTFTADTGGVDVGLLPDWPGAAVPQPTTAAADPQSPGRTAVAHNTVDVAARLSTAQDCVEDRFAVCSVGDTVATIAQILNQGRTDLTGVTAKVSLPVGDDYAGAPTLDTTSTSDGITGVAVAADPANPRQRVVTLQGTLRAGGSARVAIGVTVGPAARGSGAGVPGCRPGGGSVAPCSDREPQGRALVFGVTAVDQPGDPDSLFCAARSRLELCSTGVHDKRIEPDEIDPVGHNLPASYGVTAGFDAALRLSQRAPAEAVPAAGDVTFWLSVTNSRPGYIQAGSAVTITLPPGFEAIRQPDTTGAGTIKTGLSSLVACRTSGLVVRCTVAAPIPGQSTSFTLPVTARVAPGTPAGTRLTVRAGWTPSPSQLGRDARPADNAATRTVTVG